MSRTLEPHGEYMPGTDFEPRKDAGSTDLLAQVNKVLRQVELTLSPAAMYVYKPRKNNEGTALKLDLRLTPQFKENGYIDEVEGGLYVELVPQESNGEDGFARFGWKNDRRVAAKLGMPDVLSLLLGLRRVRSQGKPTPPAIRAKDDQDGTTVSLFHKFSSGTTSISVKFDAEKSYWRIAKSRELHQSIALSLAEEIQVEAYLTLALHSFLLTGHR